METQTTQPETSQNGNDNQPTHIAKVRHGYGKKATYDTVGVAWLNEDGTLGFKPYGKQIIEDTVIFYKNEPREDSPS